MIKLISVVGPTASGKSDLAISIALSFGGEIVSADSMQIYRGMDIASAKPSRSDMTKVPHHLIDFLPADCEYSVARYKSDADKVIDKIIREYKIPIVVGGTGLYVDSLLSGVSFAEGDISVSLRDELKLQLQNEGVDALLTELSRIDHESFERLKSERNPKRIMRAIEIYRTTGITMTEQNALSHQSQSRYLPTKIGIGFRDRDKLYDRINRRVDIMVEKGLVDEARKALESHIGTTAVQAIGHKELEPYLTGADTLDNCLETLKRSTRRYAKRQITWFGRDKAIMWFYADDYSSDSELHNAVIRFICDRGFEKQ